TSRACDMLLSTSGEGTPLRLPLSICDKYGCDTPDRLESSEMLILFAFLNTRRYSPNSTFIILSSRGLTRCRGSFFVYRFVRLFKDVGLAGVDFASNPPNNVIPRHGAVNAF